MHRWPWLRLFLLPLLRRRRCPVWRACARSVSGSRRLTAVRCSVRARAARRISAWSLAARRCCARASALQTLPAAAAALGLATCPLCPQAGCRRAGLEETVEHALCFPAAAPPLETLTSAQAAWAAEGAALLGNKSSESAVAADLLALTSSLDAAQQERREKRFFARLKCRRSEIALALLQRHGLIAPCRRPCPSCGRPLHKRTAPICPTGCACAASAARQTSSVFAASRDYRRA